MDILEPMRRAAELGCKDFDYVGGNIAFAIPDPNHACVTWCQLPIKDQPRANRYAANRCECWWRERLEWAEHESQFGDTRKRQKEADDMIDLCRAFANEHGV